MTYDRDEFMVSAAVRQVARSVIANTLAKYPPEWEEFPDIGENDRVRVVAEVERIEQQFIAGQLKEHNAAYRFLSERAGGA